MGVTIRPLIGVLALQGAYARHRDALQAAGAEVRLVKRQAELQGLNALVIPGGESSTFLKHLERDRFFEVLDRFVQHLPTFGTCAGAILLADAVTNPDQRSLHALKITVERNAYGRQVDSTIVTSPTSLPGGDLEMVFIRAPKISKIGPGVEVLAERDGDPVLVRQGNLLAATFHPELGTDARVHLFFVEMVKKHMLDSAMLTWTDPAEWARSTP